MSPVTQAVPLGRSTALRSPLPILRLLPNSNRRRRKAPSPNQRQLFLVQAAKRAPPRGKSTVSWVPTPVHSLGWLGSSRPWNWEGAPEDPGFLLLLFSLSTRRRLLRFPSHCVSHPSKPSSPSPCVGPVARGRPDGRPSDASPGGLYCLSCGQSPLGLLPPRYRLSCPVKKPKGEWLRQDGRFPHGSSATAGSRAKASLLRKIFRDSVRLLHLWLCRALGSGLHGQEACALPRGARPT